LKIIYLTYDGLRQALGSSQILPYLRGLRDRGITSMIISLERGAAPTQDAFEPGIRRIELPYRAGGVPAHVANFRGMLRELRRTIEAEKPDLVVARSYLPGIVALRAKKSHRVPYIFDMRACWVDERAMGNGRFRNPLAYSFGKRMERLLLRHAAGVVTLTKLHAEDLLQQQLIFPETPVKVIPTCADFDQFRADSKIAHDALVIGWIGSVNASYHLAPSLELFKTIRRLRPNAFLQCVTGQAEEMLGELKQAGIPPENYSVTSAEHKDMPRILANMDWGLLLNQNGPGKRGSMPTKLAEFFASGIRPIQYGCNQEVADLVRASGSGIVLNGLSPKELEQAAQHIANHPLDKASVEAARRRMRPYFGLEAGIAGYAELLHRVSEHPRRTK